ncbi:MAG: phosphate ABC transporter ATP-binding protein PstB [Coriobacteriales bacterium]
MPGSFTLEDVSVTYGTETAVAGVNSFIEAGKVTSLIGPSGCGKSTLLRCLNRMNDMLGNVTVGGTLKLDDEDIYNGNLDEVELRMRVGMVFQQPAVFPLSIYDNVAYGPRLRGLKRGPELDDLVESCLTRAALWDEVKDDLKKSALGLSGGQQQRLCIARALATNPEVLLMDEPCSALDPISTSQIEETIRTLAGQMTIVIVTHNMQQATRVSDNTMFMLRESMERPATLIEQGPTDQIFSTPKDERTENYITGHFG